jgi:hypothetical protein
MGMDCARGGGMRMIDIEWWQNMRMDCGQNMRIKTFIVILNIEVG